MTAKVRSAHPASEWHHPAIAHHGQKVVLFCNEGYQSSLAAANLQQLGLRYATDMAGGFSSWRESGLPIVPFCPTQKTVVIRDPGESSKSGGLFIF